MSTQEDAPLDLLGRKLKVGDHVVWGVSGSIRHGFITAIVLKKDNWGKMGHWIRATGDGCKMARFSGDFCAIVLPDIQDPEVQLAGEAPPVSALD